jgi:hypothetical protein
MKISGGCSSIVGFINGKLLALKHQSILHLRQGSPNAHNSTRILVHCYVTSEFEAPVTASNEQYFCILLQTRPLASK